MNPLFFTGYQPPQAKSPAHMGGALEIRFLAETRHPETIIFPPLILSLAGRDVSWETPSRTRDRSLDSNV